MYPKMSSAPQPAAAGQGPLPVPKVYNLGVSQAIELEKASLALAVCMNSCAMDMCRHMLWYPFNLAGWFGAENQTVASCLELHRHWLGLLSPQGVAMLTADIADPEPSDEEVDYGIDVAASIFEDEILA
jgi:hypothetical protein